MSGFSFASAAVAMWAVLASAAAAPEQDRNCLACHAGIEPISEKMADVTCVDCHKGDAEATAKETAHVGMHRNPADYRVAEETCGACHPEHLHNSLKSLHATSAGIIGGSRYLWGAQPGKGSLYGNRAVSDADGDAPKRKGGLAKLDAVVLRLGPFQGRVACTTIPVGKGVCSRAAAERRTVIVADVREFPGHIACDARSRAELAAPLLKRNEVWGVLDLDSPAKNRFLLEEGRLLEDFCRVLLEPWDEAPWRAGAG